MRNWLMEPCVEGCAKAGRLAVTPSKEAVAAHAEWSTKRRAARGVGRAVFMIFILDETAL
jgi:hypothetical protein